MRERLIHGEPQSSRPNVTWKVGGPWEGGGGEERAPKSKICRPSNITAPPPPPPPPHCLIPVSATAPDKPGDKEYDELVTLLTRHMAPKPLVIAERFRFHKRDQREGESINEYAAELQRLSEHCDFGTGLNDALRDRLVCGIRDEGVQKRLLTKENLTFDKALKMAEAAEQAGKDAAQFHDTSRLEKPLEDVHVVQGVGEDTYAASAGLRMSSVDFARKRAT